MTRFYKNSELTWDGLILRFGPRGRILAKVVPDDIWPKMYRVQLPDGTKTDMVNLPRAKDAARSLALGHLQRTQGTDDGEGSD